MLDLGPVLRIELRLSDGAVLRRDVSMEDVEQGLDLERFRDPPGWLLNPRKQWGHPQDPITMLGDVPRGREADARAWVES